MQALVIFSVLFMVAPFFIWFYFNLTEKKRGKNPKKWGYLKWCFLILIPIGIVMMLFGLKYS